MMTLTITSKTYGVFIVKYSDEDHDFIKLFNWYIHKTRDGLCYVRSSKGTLHRMLMGNPSCYVDHANRDTLDNTRPNLRLVTNSQSSINRRKQKRTNEFKGVDFIKACNKYRVRITINYKVIFGGNFSNKEAAAMKYNELAKEHHGEYAILNQI